MPLSEPFRHGLRAVIPTALGVFTFGTITGVATVGAGIPAFLAMAMGTIVYAGSAQLVALQLALGGAPLVVIGLAACVVNLRFVLYSIACAPYVRRRSRRWKWAQSYLLSDNGFGHAAARALGHPDDPGAADYLMATCIATYVCWCAGIVVGAALGAGIPAGWSLEFVVTLTFLVLGLATVRDRAMALAFVVAAGVAVLAWDLPYRLGLAAATIAGIGAGLALERSRPREGA